MLQDQQLIVNNLLPRCGRPTGSRREISTGSDRDLDGGFLFVLRSQVLHSLLKPPAGCVTVPLSLGRRFPRFVRLIVFPRAGDSIIRGFDSDPGHRAFSAVTLSESAGPETGSEVDCESEWTGLAPGVAKTSAASLQVARIDPPHLGARFQACGNLYLFPSRLWQSPFRGPSSHEERVFIASARGAASYSSDGRTPTLIRVILPPLRLEPQFGCASIPTVARAENIGCAWGFSRSAWTGPGGSARVPRSEPSRLVDAACPIGHAPRTRQGHHFQTDKPRYRTLTSNRSATTVGASQCRSTPDPTTVWPARNASSSVAVLNREAVGVTKWTVTVYSGIFVRAVGHIQFLPRTPSSVPFALDVSWLLAVAVRLTIGVGFRLLILARW